MDIHEELERLGMSPKKVTVYLTLLQTKGCTVTELSALSEIKRTTCLPILSQLVEEKLVSESRRGRWVVYTANDPKMILEETQKRERLPKRILPELNALQEISGLKPVIQYHDGVKGARFSYSQLLKSEEREYFYYASIPHFATVMGESFLRDFLAERKRMGIWANGIRVYDEKFMDPDFMRADEGNLRRVRYLPNAIDHYVACMNFTDDKIFITSVVGEAYGLIIESAGLTTLMKSIWKMVWDISLEHPEESRKNRGGRNEGKAKPVPARS